LKATTERTILVVEDDPMLGELVTECLERDGHAVTWARSGDEALQQAATLPAIDLLLTDLTMPGLDPRVAAARLRQDRPTLKVVFMSGQFDANRPEESDGFLAKPFTPADIRQAVARALGPAPKGRAETDESIKPTKPRRSRP
jgi:CheY-like chemotaxis protein